MLPHLGFIKSLMRQLLSYNFIQNILKHYDSYHFHKNSNSYFPLNLHPQNILNDTPHSPQLSVT